VVSLQNWAQRAGIKGLGASGLRALNPYTNQSINPFRTEIGIFILGSWFSASYYNMYKCPT
jgi:hypothetical protein